jgi:serine/threonine protein kinase
MGAERNGTLLENLKDCSLLDANQLRELENLPEARDPDPLPLARILVQRGWLTKFQVNLLAQGRGADLLLGPYVLLERLGEGGMGQVYKARHQPMQRIVALKLIRKERLASPDAVARFHREVQAVAHLAHPNIVAAYDAGRAGATHYMAMEYVEGIDLARLVREEGPLPVAMACEYARQAALGLQHAHERGLVHRDVKPANLLVQGEGVQATIKILDLGLARLTGAGGEKGLTQSGQVVGTPDYLAPEQAINARTADIRSDLYGLGGTLYFLLTGWPPFPAESLAELLIKHQMNAPPRLRERRADVPEELEVLVRKLLAKKPQERYQTPAELIAALEPFCQGHAPTRSEPDGQPMVVIPAARLAQPRSVVRAAPGSIAPHHPLRRRVSRGNRKALVAVLALVGVAVVAMVAVAAVLMRGQQRPREMAAAPSTPTVPTPPVQDPPPRPQPIPQQQPQVEPEPKAPPFGDLKLPPLLKPAPQAKPPEKPPEKPKPQPPPEPAAPRASDYPLDNLDPQTIPPEDRLANIPELVAVLTGHTDEVWGVTFSPDGKRLASASKDGTVRVWDLMGRQPRPVGTTGGKGGNLASASFTPDGTQLALGTGSFVEITDLQAKQRLIPVQGAKDACVCFSPDGRLLAVGAGSEVRLLDATRGYVSGLVLRGHTSNKIWAVLFSRDGTTLVSSGQDHTVRLWDLTARPPRQRMEIRLRNEPMTPSLSPDGQRLACGCFDGTVFCWDVSGPQARERWSMKSFRGWANSVAFAPDGKSLIATEGGGSGGKHRVVWYTADGGVLKEWVLPERCSQGTFDPSGRYLALTCHNANVYILRLPAVPK